MSRNSGLGCKEGKMTPKNTNRLALVEWDVGGRPTRKHMSPRPCWGEGCVAGIRR